MIKLPLSRLKGRHPSEDDLVDFVDGQLAPRRASRIRKHLNGCWACRLKTEETQQAIGALVNYLNHLPAIIPPPSGRKQFRAGLRAVVVSAAEDSAPSRLRLALSQAFSGSSPVLRLASGCLVLFLAGLLFTYVVSNQVSADQVLRNATESHAQRVQAVPAPVVYQKLKVKRSGRVPSAGKTVTWEIWTDPSSSRLLQYVQDDLGRRLVDTDTPGLHRNGLDVPDVLVELREVFRANTLDWREPLSARSYQSWRGAVGDKWEDVAKERLSTGEEVIRLRTVPTNPAAAGSIAAAALVVRTRDWHPVEKHFRVKGQEQDPVYQLTEAVFEVVSLNVLRPGFFSPPFLEPEPTPGLTMNLTRLVLRPTLTAINSSETGARFLIHQQAPDLEHQVEFGRVSGQEVEVRGSIETLGSKKQLLAALKKLPYVSLRLQPANDRPEAKAPANTDLVESGTASSSAPALVDAGDANTPQHKEAPAILQELERYFAQRRQVFGPDEEPGEASMTSAAQETEELVTRSLSLSSSTLAEAWALRRLAERYPGEEITTLDDKAKRMVALMVQDHLRELRIRLNSARAPLDPVLLALASQNVQRVVTRERNSAPLAVDASWSEKIVAADLPECLAPLFISVRHLDQVLRGLFAGGASVPELSSHQAADAPARSTENLIHDLLQALANLEVEVVQVERQIANYFLGDFLAPTPVSRNDQQDLHSLPGTGRTESGERSQP